MEKKTGVRKLAEGWRRSREVDNETSYIPINLSRIHKLFSTQNIILAKPTTW